MERLDDFKLYLQREEIDIGTIEKHISSLKNLFNKLGNFTSTTLEQYLFNLRGEERSPGHLNNLVAAARHWGDFIGIASFREIKYFKIKETYKGIMSDEEIRRFLAITPEQMGKFLQTRNKVNEKHKYKITIDKDSFELFTLFFTTLAHTGLRPKEGVKLRTSQVDFGANVLRLDQRTKTGEPRTVALSGTLRAVLEPYIQTLTGNRLFPDWNRHQWKHQFNTRRDFLGIKREKISTYSLRHSWITDLLDNEANVIVVSDMAGHSNLNTTAHYYKLTTKSKTKAIKKLSLARDDISQDEKALLAKESLEKDGHTVVEFRKLKNGNYRIEIS